MRWFKHLTDASDDDFLKAVEHTFGWEGYGRWWKLCEIVGKPLKKRDTVAARTLPWSEWQTKLKGKREKLRSFLGFLEDHGRISQEETGEILTISLPKLLKYRDEYTKKSGQESDDTPDSNPGKVHSKSTENRVVQSTESSPSEKKVKSARDLVEELVLDDELREYARKRGLDPDDVFEDWRLHYRGNGYKTTAGPVKDARATFMRWCRTGQQIAARQASFARPNPNAGAPVRRFQFAPEKPE
jgi:hypothetical protein